MPKAFITLSLQGENDYKFYSNFGATTQMTNDICELTLVHTYNG